MPINVSSDAQLIEIPINLRLRLIGSEKNQLFVSGGLSTYYMLNERYTFNYHYSDGDNTIPGLEVSGKNNHLFSIINLSFGFHHRLNKKVGIEVEPFIKLPTYGIGIWDVDLTSTGTAFTTSLLL